MNRNGIVVFSLLIFLGLSANSLLANETVLLNNENRLIPLTGLDTRKIAVLQPLEDGMEAFGEQLARYADVRLFYWSAPALESTWLDESIKLYNTLIFMVPADQADLEPFVDFIKAQSKGKDVVVLLAGSGGGLHHFDQADFPVLWTAGPDAKSLRDAAMSIFGGLGCTAKLPANFSDKYTKGAGSLTARTRLCYTGTEGTQVNAQMLGGAIDAIMAEAIRARATPGGVVMVVQNGNVLFEKAYGHHTYERQRATRVSDIFDTASITKIAATTAVVMRLVEQGKIDLAETIGHYLWQTAGTNKEDTKLRDVMLHEAGFVPYIPFYRRLGRGDLRRDSSASHAVKVADHLFIRTGYYQQVMWPAMLESELRSPGKYVYSDISIYIMKEIAEHQTAVPLEDYVQEAFYQPLGMQTAGYNPRERFDRDRIVPTEDDREFRKTLLRGYVHDQGAAMAGGVAGHAGLFATANDLAIYGQLLLNRGQYGGERYFQPETVDFFTSRQSTSSRRGLGFDRRDLRPGSNYPSGMASDATFGHTGYTGTALWIDPANRLVFIFLSNRVHPQVSSKLADLAIRRRILDVVYVAIR